MNRESSRHSLATRTCTPCQGGIPPLKGEELEQWLAQLGRGWHIVAEHHLAKTFIFPDFRQALAFTHRAGEIAERMGHHPEIELGWGRVVVRIWTHKISGLTDADFIFAARVEEES